MQLENIIGKLKSEKYGSKILEEIKGYESGNQKLDHSADYSPEKEHERSHAKKLKSAKNLVVVESSEDERWKIKFLWRLM